MSDDLFGHVQRLDRCWLERRFGDLEHFLAEDVVMVAPDGRARIVGRAEAVASYRAFMDAARVRDFRAFDPIVTRRGDTAVVEYRWAMGWEASGGAHEEEGREIVVLALCTGRWEVVWRTQLR